MLGSQRKTEQLAQEDAPAQEQGTKTTSALVPTPPVVTYERATVYLRPGQRQWLEEVLDKQARDAAGKRLKSISASDIVRLAIDRLQGAVQEEGLPLLEELIWAANKDAEIYTGRKNRGIPKR